MPDWLNNVTTTTVESTLTDLVIRLFLAWFCGACVAWLARCMKPSTQPDTLTLTLILMSILIAMATQTIGDNVARAFSLVGALSIVRFRTAVPETRDVAFVLAAVVVGMAVGAGQYWVVLVGLVVVALASLLNRANLLTSNKPLASSDSKPNTWRLTLVTGLSASEGWQTELTRLAESHELLSVETARRGGAMELAYRLVPKSDVSAVDLVAALNAVPTVESVTAKAI